VSAAYSNTDETSVWYIRSLVLSVRRLSLHIRFRDVMTAQARPIRQVCENTYFTGFFSDSFAKKRDFLRFLECRVKSHKKSLAKVLSSNLRNEFIYFAQ